jgi:hypothetical protein
MKKNYGPGVQRGVEIDQLMAKFNNSLAIQNMGVFNANTTQTGIGGGVNPSKSRNNKADSFKTTASIGSNKGGLGTNQKGSNMMTHTYIEGTSSNLQN